MSTFLYFAYGSNMLTSRLRERCPSAQPVGVVRAEGYAVEFYKNGQDGSGKATLVSHPAGQSGVHGVLYQIDLGERHDLDRAEARYDRHDQFTVFRGQGIDPIVASTYIAQPDACHTNLVPFDWYVALIVAGAQEHGLDKDYVAKLLSVATSIDPNAERTAYMNQLMKRR